MEFVETGDGSLTVRHEGLGELYHSDRGAVGEAEHVYIRAGFDRVIEKADRKSISVFEVGFGAGLNCWLTYRRAEECGIHVDYRAIDLYPVNRSVTEKLNYTDSPVFKEIHNVIWDGALHPVGERFSLAKYRADLSMFDFESLREQTDVVYFDAFAPDAQPELWSERIMSRMYAILKPGGVWVTYSSKGSVKQALRAVGFEVTRLPGALGKRHMVRAIKPMD